MARLALPRVSISWACCSGEGPAPSNEPKEFGVADLAGVDDGLKFGGA
jgi:hypothetical protein